MWKRFLTRERLPLGLAWEEDGIRIIEIDHGRPGYRVKAFNFPFPDPVVETGCQAGHRLLAEFMRRIVAENRWHKKPVVTALPSHQVIIRNLKFPQMPRADLHKAVVWEISQILDGDLSAFTYDYLVAEEPAPGDEQKDISVMIAAMEREKVMAFYRLFVEAGFQLQAIDVVPLALKRALLGKGETIDGRKPVVLLDLGNCCSQLAVIDEGMLTLTRSLPYSFSGPGEHDRVPGGTAAPPHSKLLLEIKKTLDFFQAERRRQVTGIIASGRALSPLSLQMLHMDLGIQVIPGLPGRGLRLDRYPDPSYAVAMGLALKGVRD